MRRFLFFLISIIIALSGCKKKTTEPSQGGSDNGGGNGGGTSTVVWENTYTPQNGFDVDYFVKSGNQYFAYDFGREILVSFKEDGSGFQEKNLTFNVLWTLHTDFYDYGNGIVLLFEGEHTIVDIDYNGNIIREIDYGYMFSGYGRPFQIVKVNDGYMMLLKTAFDLVDPADSVFLGKIDFNGQMVFVKFIDIPFSQKTYGLEANDLAVLSDNNVLLLITRFDTLGYNWEYINFIIKTDLSGAEIWRKQTQVFDNKYLQNICTVSSGAILDFGDFENNTIEFYFITESGNLTQKTVDFTPDRGYIFRPKGYTLTRSDDPDAVFLVIFDSGADLKGNYKILKFNKDGNVLDIKIFPQEEAYPEYDNPHFFAREGTDGVIYVKTAIDTSNNQYLVYGKIK
jgi:hypothetical protein